ncbi:MAG: hydrogenase formation protein HypD [Anaerolineae bacterium]|nr:hydrogenase formation protein HypD [Anaerolineae bacterium]
MRYLSDFRDAAACAALAERIRRLAHGAGEMQFMEFCGGHTHAIARHGLRSLLPENVRLVSGPGCPVCVSSQGDVDRAVALAGRDGVTVVTFGDMMQVPGSEGSLQEARALGADVRVVYSPADALRLAVDCPGRQVVFLGVGFETTAPAVAATVLQAQRQGITNYSVLSLHKLTPPAMRAVLDAGEVRLDGVIGPGHVSTVIGAGAWRFLPEEHGLGCAVAGFEPADLLLAVAELVRMVVEGRPEVANCYRRSVSDGGNSRALAVMEQAFQVVDADWRGLGVVPASGLHFRPELADLDAGARLALPKLESREPAGCRCGEVLRGVLEPSQCPLFGSACTPESPVGPCMVSTEGACSAHYLLREAG